ncbi:unnamed protein product [Effrenium voratum]|nr:unnamed protein product [Effrenium voratum]
MLFHDLAIGTMLLQSGLHLETPVLRPEQVADAQYWASTSNDTMSSCAAARAVRNFSWFSQTWAGSYTALKGSPAYSDPAIKTLDGVFIWDAEYCALSGLLDLPKEQLLQNYSAVMAIQEAVCGTEPLKSLKLHALEDDVWTEVDEDFKIQEQKPPSKRKAPLQREGILDRVSARHCAGGSYSCMVTSAEAISKSCPEALNLRSLESRPELICHFCNLGITVNALEPLLSSERWELACNATGFVHFKPWERVLTQGKVRQARQWYVIYGGSAVMKLDREDGSCQQLAEVFRPGCFGERSLLRGDAAYDVNVLAGAEGMTCLTFNGETIRVLLTRIYTESPGFIPDIYADVEEWCQLKARRRVNSEANQLGPSNAKDSLEKFAKLGLLGRGAYGEVLLVEDTVRKKPYALKVMSKGHIQRKGVVRQVWLTLFMNTTYSLEHGKGTVSYLDLSLLHGIQEGTYDLHKGARSFNVFPSSSRCNTRKTGCVPM